MTAQMPSKLAWLKANGTLNPYVERVNDTLFQTQPFFDPNDMLQVKYEMLRRVRSEGWPVAQAATTFGFSRPAFYKAQQAFSQHGLAGLLPRKRGPRAAHKLTTPVMTAIQQWLTEEPGLSSQTLAQRLAKRLQLSIHPRSIERALQRPSQKKPAHSR